MILPECRPLWDGIERADSLVLNPTSGWAPALIYRPTTAAIRST